MLMGKVVQQGDQLTCLECLKKSICGYVHESIYPLKTDSQTKLADQIFWQLSKNPPAGRVATYPMVLAG